MTKEEFEAYADRAKILIKENPLVAVLVAAAVGFALAKITEKKIVYIEKGKS